MILKFRGIGFLQANPTTLTMALFSNIYQENLQHFFFDYTSSRNFGYASGTCEWLFKELGPEKHLGTHKMELRQGQDNMASSPLLYSEAFESITSGTWRASLQDSSTFLQEISENISPTFSNTTSPQAVYFTRNKWPALTLGNLFTNYWLTIVFSWTLFTESIRACSAWDTP